MMPNNIAKISRYITYGKLKSLVEKEKFEKNNSIVKVIEESPILEADLKNYPIPGLKKILENKRPDLTIETIPKDVHDSKLKKNRSEIKEWLDIQCKGINFKSNEDYKTQLLAIFHKNNENWLNSLEDSYKEGRNREADGIITDFPKYIEAIFSQYDNPAITGKESLYWLLENISKLEGEAQRDAEICLLDTINMARLAYDQPCNIFPDIKDTRYSCMPGLHDRLLDTIFFYIPIEKKIETESFIDEYYRVAVKMYKSQFNLTIGYLSYILLSDKSTSFWDLTEVLT